MGSCTKILDVYKIIMKKIDFIENMKNIENDAGEPQRHKMEFRVEQKRAKWYQKGVER